MHLPKTISHRLSALSYNEEIFSKAKTPYQETMKSSGYEEELVYRHGNTTQSRRKNRRRNIIWFNPLHSKSVQINIARTFLNLANKHFPPSHKYHKLFNKNDVKWIIWEARSRRIIGKSFMTMKRNAKTIVIVKRRNYVHSMGIVEQKTLCTSAP